MSKINNSKKKNSSSNNNNSNQSRHPPSIQQQQQQTGQNQQKKKNKNNDNSNNNTIQKSAISSTPPKNQQQQHHNRSSLTPPSSLRHRTSQQQQQHQIEEEEGNVLLNNSNSNSNNSKKKKQKKNRNNKKKTMVRHHDTITINTNERMNEDYDYDEYDEYDHSATTDKSSATRNNNNNNNNNSKRLLLTSSDVNSSQSAESLSADESDPILEVGNITQHSSSASIQISTSGTTTATGFKGDYHKFVYHIPQRFEDTWMKFDDFWIAVCQKYQSPIIKYLCKIITFITSIEIGITTPYVLYAWGWDYLATIALYMVLSLTVVSQIPKRFVYRKRPHVAGRAVRMSKNHTSSFPSRAVTCAIMYAAFACFALRWILRDDPKATFSFWFWVWPAIIISFFVTSFARIYLGVHYPSDCVFAALQATICFVLGLGLYFLNVAICPSCIAGACYARTVNAITLSNMANVNWLLFSGLTLAFLITAIVTVIAVNFFVKFHHVFGLTLPCLTFRLTTLCQTLSWDGKTSLAKPNQFAPHWYAYLFAFGTGLILTVVGMLAPKGKSSILTFSVMYAATFVSLLLWRASYI